MNSAKGGINRGMVWRFKTSLWLWVGVGLCLSALLSCEPPPGEPVPFPLPTSFQALEKRYQIAIYYDQLQKTVPDYWRQAPISFHYIPISEKDLSLLYPPIQAALAQYPDAVIKNNLRALGLAKQLSFFNTQYGATYTETQPQRNTIYLSRIPNLDEAEVYDYVLDSVHHEFSSILLKKYPFPEKAWRAANPSGFRYQYESSDNPGLTAMQNSDVHQTGAVFFSNGFLSAYSQASLEEDLNVFSGEVFTHPQAILEKARRYPRIAQKLRVWLGFYGGLDSSFKTKPLFQNLAKAGFRASNK